MTATNHDAVRRNANSTRAKSHLRDSPERFQGPSVVDPLPLQPRQDLEEFFHPEAVAIVGSVNRNADPKALAGSYDARWGKGRWYLVNAKGGSVGPIPIYKHVTDIPSSITVAVINVGTKLVAGVVEECGKHGVRYVLIFSAGFSEVGAKGAALEREVGEMARRFGIRVFGPNTNTNAFEVLPEPPRLRGGRIGLITQSGHQGRPIVQGIEFGVAFSRWVPTGNELDYEAADFIEYFAHDPATAVIAGYFEGFRDPSKLRRALEAANAQRKPIVALKMGATQAGTRMAASHTGHLAGSDAVVRGLFEQHGVVRVADLDELLETAALFAKLPAGTGPGAGLYSISGGSGTLMAEVAEASGVTVPLLAPKTRKELRALIPEYLTVANPVDNGAQFLLQAPQDQRRRVFELLADDPGVDVIVVGLTGALGKLTDRFADDVVAFADDLAVPVVVTWNSFKTDDRGFKTLVDSGLPLFRSFRNCFSALAAFSRYQKAASTFRARPPAQVRLPRAAKEVLEAASRSTTNSPRVLGPEQTRSLLDAFSIPLVPEELVSTAANAARAASRLGFPVVMKIASAQIPHRSDAGLVKLGIESASGARAAFEELTTKARTIAPEARIDGVQVQPQVPPGTEMIVGVTRDPVFGSALLVGTGGIFAEILADTALRPLPIDRRDVEEMLRSLRGYRLLEGVRGRPPGDVRELVKVVMAVARLAGACGNHLAELDLNPVVVHERGAVVVDCLAVLNAAPA